jgi:hypothetical protein
MNGRQWSLLAQITMKFIVIAKESGFCLDLLNEIERRLYKESPFSIHHKERSFKK